MKKFGVYFTPVQREDILDTARSILKQTDFSEVDRRNNGIKAAVQQRMIAVLAKLPETVETKKMFLRRCCGAADTAIEKLAGVCDEKLLQKVRHTIKIEITFLLYEEYLEELMEFVKEYSKKHAPPKRWGIGFWQQLKGEKGETKGRALYHFWRIHIERDGDDEFRRRLLPEFPAEWQERYRLNKKCPYDWGGMTAKKNAEVLIDFKQSGDPASKKWGLGSIYYWTGSQEEPWGKSFYDFWRSHIDEEGDSEFRRLMLPHFPEQWQKNYELQSFPRYRSVWSRMSDEEIAGTLQKLQKRSDPGRSQWGLGSLVNWFGEENERFGKSFYKYWTDSVEGDRDDEFRCRILPHLPQKWQEQYEMRTYQRCPHEWGGMNGRQIAGVLQNLKKLSDPTCTIWGFGSIQQWMSEKGERWGKSFYDFWKKNMEMEGDKAFRQLVLPYLPQEWKDNYRTRVRDKLQQRHVSPSADFVIEEE